MRFLQWLGFRASDEMDVHISGMAMRLSWAALQVLLLGWSFYDVLKEPVLPGQFTVLCVGQVVFWATHIYVQRNLTRAGEGPS
jgi:hypothetical protein